MFPGEQQASSVDSAKHTKFSVERINKFNEDSYAKRVIPD